MRTINRNWPALLIALVAALLPLAVTLLTSVSFTLNGYDVDGGTDPICWRLAWWPQNQYLSFQNFKMMEACYPGTILRVTPLDLDNDENVQVMHTNDVYTFRIEAQVDFGAITKDFKDELNIFLVKLKLGPLTSPVLTFRIVLCDTTRIGFCNPLAVADTVTNESEFHDYIQHSSKDWLDNVSQGEVLQLVRVGNHIFSPWLYLPLQEVSPQNYTTSQDIKLVLPPGKRGAFFVIGHAHFQVHMKADNKTDEFVQALEWLRDQLNLTEMPPEPQVATFNYEPTNETNVTEEVFLWVEIADSVPDNVVDVRPPPTVLGVSDAMRIGVGVVSGLFSLVSLALIVFIVRHREHMVMKLAQWQFLLWLVACALVSNVFVFTYMPTKDWHCRYGDLIEYVSLTMIGCILVGRLWRVYLTVSSAISIGKGQNTEKATGSCASVYIKEHFVSFLTMVAKFPYNCRMSEAKEEMAQARGGGFRKQVTAWETTRLILWLSLPQIVTQVVGVIVYDTKVEIRYDDMNMTGRKFCAENGEWGRRVGVILTATAYATAVVIAWLSRDLPSAFNETDGIFQAATINTIVGLLAISLDQIAGVSNTPPDIIVFLWVATSLIVTSTALGFIVIPKVMRVRSGEEIIISNILAQQRQSSLSPSEHGYSSQPSRPSALEHSRSIHLKQNEAIPKRLERNLLDTNELILGVRNELVQGRTPTLKEWEKLISKVDQLHNTFERLEFEWTETNERDQ